MNDGESINGWKPPVIYDHSTDTHRIATQEDIDRMQRDLRVLGQFYGTVRETVRDIESDLKRHQGTSA